jgi:parvulin-like peptidyl-prolyl isomerase
VANDVCSSVEAGKVSHVMQTELRLALALMLVGGGMASPVGATGPAAVTQATDPAVFAVVDGTVISTAEFAAAMRAGVRRKYYHGKVPDSAIPAFQREVGRDLIRRVLLLKEAERRSVVPDPGWVQPRLERFEQRYRRHAREASEEERQRALAQARTQLEMESRIRNLEAAVRAAVPEATEAVVRAYYDAHPEKFTEPERFRVSAILLEVDASAPAATWQAARDEAEDLVRRLRGGADFAELARLHSGDASAADGGDMGYLHRGMLGAPAQEAVDAAAIGEVLDPVRLLEGVAIFRVDERPPRRLRDFDEVRERAAALRLQEERDAAWNGLLERLEAQAHIRVNEQHYLPMPG